MSEETSTSAASPEAPPPPPPPSSDPPAGPAPSAEEPWATRFGLVRPRHGRYLAGVCAAIGRATNTDPLLWRVLIGVLAIFGVGIIIYLAGWLLTPAEGDTASPVEALFGRGTSSTSSVLTLVLGVIAVVLLGALTDSWVVSIIAAVGLVVVAMAVNSGTSTPRPATVPPPPPGSEPIPSAASPAPVTETLPQPPVAAYQPPFAPHGPYQAAPYPVPPKIAVPKPKPEPSRLGRLIFGLVLIAMGVLGVADMAGASVPGGAYVAVALAVVGLGLIIGAWYGRARGFIALGLILAILLPMVASGPDMSQRGRGGRVLWNPNTAERVSDSYEHRFGEATLDLSRVDFTGRDREIVADISFGEMRIVLPPGVDTTIYSNITAGDASVFGRDINGVGVDQSQDDLGEDGPGGGTLVIHLNVRFGHAEVTR
jgi:phage shock protein PspC (stress-responsive transcriptional regulator)